MRPATVATHTWLCRDHAIGQPVSTADMSPRITPKAVPQFETHSTNSLLAADVPTVSVLYPEVLLWLMYQVTPP